MGAGREREEERGEVDSRHWSSTEGMGVRAYSTPYHWEGVRSEAMSSELLVPSFCTTG